MPRRELLLRNQWNITNSLPQDWPQSRPVNSLRFLQPSPHSASAEKWHWQMVNSQKRPPRCWQRPWPNTRSVRKYCELFDCMRIEWVNFKSLNISNCSLLMRLDGNCVEHWTNKATLAYAPGPKQCIFSVYCEYSQAARAVGSEGLLRRGKVRSQQTWDSAHSGLTIQMMPGDTRKEPTQGLWSFWSLLSILRHKPCIMMIGAFSQANNCWK